MAPDRWRQCGIDSRDWSRFVDATHQVCHLLANYVRPARKLGGGGGGLCRHTSAPCAKKCGPEGDNTRNQR
jgi:hypothetical protein